MFSFLISLLSILLVVGFLIMEVNILNADDEQKSPSKLSLTMVTRNEWNASDPSASLIELNLPVEKIIISHTMTSECR